MDRTGIIKIVIHDDSATAIEAYNKYPERIIPLVRIGSVRPLEQPNGIRPKARITIMSLILDSFIDHAQLDDSPCSEPADYR